METVAVVDDTFYKEPKAAEKIIKFLVKNRNSIKLQNLELNAYFPHDFDGEILAKLVSSIQSFTDYSDLEGDVIKPILERVGKYESKTEKLVIFYWELRVFTDRIEPPCHNWDNEHHCGQQHCEPESLKGEI